MSQPQFADLEIGKAAADEYLRLPRLPELFQKRADRMAALAPGHPIEAFLDLTQRVFGAQAAVCGMFAPSELPPPQAIQLAHEHQMPLVQPDVWLPTETYRQTLRALVQNISHDGLPASTVDVLRALSSATDEHLNGLALSYLGRDIPPHQHAEMLFIAAALQVEYAQVAAQIQAEAVRPLEVSGLCPMCGSAPIAGVVVADQAFGRRYLTCSLCCTSWNHVRVACIVCADEKQTAYHEIEGGKAVAKAETCSSCQSYSKLFYQAKDMGVDPMSDDLATFSLDLLVREEGFNRNAPNPFVLVL